MKILDTLFKPRVTKADAAALVAANELAAQYDAIAGQAGAAKTFLQAAAGEMIVKLRAETAAKHPHNPRIYEAWIRRLGESGMNPREAIDHLQPELVKRQAEKLAQAGIVRSAAVNPPATAAPAPAPAPSRATSPASRTKFDAMNWGQLRDAVNELSPGLASRFGRMSSGVQAQETAMRKFLEGQVAPDGATPPTLAQLEYCGSKVCEQFQQEQNKKISHEIAEKQGWLVARYEATRDVLFDLRLNIPGLSFTPCRHREIQRKDVSLIGGVERKNWIPYQGWVDSFFAELVCEGGADDLPNRNRDGVDQARRFRARESDKAISATEEREAAYARARKLQEEAQRAIDACGGLESYRPAK